MRKKGLLFLIAFTLLSGFQLINPIEVKAILNETLVETPITNVYYTRRGGGKEYMSAQYNTYTMNGKVVYCIEPGIDITTYSYIGYDGLVASPYDSATNKKIELIGHYGYDYPGHQTLRYRMATQLLIWEETGGQIVEFWTERYGNGDFINLNSEKNEIMRLVNDHYNKPSFNGNTVNAVVGQELKITDTNNLLSEYEIYNSNDFKIRIDGNDIYATPLITGELTLSVVRKNYDNNTTIVFRSADDNSQKMGYFRFSDPVLASIKVKSIGGDITINKLDKDSQSSTPQGAESTLQGAIYGIYDFNDNLITKITTDENGYVKSDTLSALGNYYLKEITPSKGYELDENKYYFSITNENLHPVINVYEDIIDRDLELYKFFANPDTGVLIPEQSIQFGIYDSKGTYISTIETDNQGYAKINLVYGTYTIKQLNTTLGHEKVKDIKVAVNENSPQTIKYSLSNAPIKAKLKVLKIDNETKLNIPLKDITFRIKNTSTNEYVCQKITYPNVENVCDFKTDSNGIFYTPFGLTSGTYILEEVDQKINSYLWNNQGIEFTIGDDTTFIDDPELGAILEIQFANTPVKGQVTINKLGESVELTLDGLTYTEISLKGVKLGLFADEDIIDPLGNLIYKKGTKIAELITDENGFASIDNLYLGKYYIQELETIESHVLDNTKYKFELKYQDQYTAVITYETTIKNHLPKGTLEFTKTDISGSKALPNTTIEIYTETEELVFTGVTDENGKIILSDLPIGKYYILEKNAPEGYELNPEKMYFEITEDKQFVKSTMLDEVIEVPNTGLSSINWETIGALVLGIFGLGIIVYANKKNKKHK